MELIYNEGWRTYFINNDNKNGATIKYSMKYDSFMQAAVFTVLKKSKYNFPNNNNNNK